MKKVLLSLITLGLIAQAQQAKAFAAVVGIASLGQVNVTEACRMEPDDLDMMSVMLVAPFSVLCYLDAHTNKTINYSAQDLLDNGYSPESVQQIVAGQSALGEWMQKNKLAFDFKKANSAQHFANQLATVPGINGEYIQFVTTGAIPSIVTQQQ